MSNNLNKNGNPVNENEELNFGCEFCLGAVHLIHSSRLKRIEWVERGFFNQKRANYNHRLDLIRKRLSPAPVKETQWLL